MSEELKACPSDTDLLARLLEPSMWQPVFLEDGENCEFTGDDAPFEAASIIKAMEGEIRGLRERHAFLLACASDGTPTEAEPGEAEVELVPLAVVTRILEIARDAPTYRGLLLITKRQRDYYAVQGALTAIQFVAENAIAALRSTTPVSETPGEKIQRGLEEAARWQAGEGTAKVHRVPVSVVDDDALVERLWEVTALLKRYRNETPSGHSPHMICHLADAAIERAEAALSDQQGGV